MKAGPIHFDEERILTVRVRTLLAVLAAFGVVAVAWAMTKADVSNHEGRLSEVEKELRESRGILIRIDTRTEEMDRRLQRRGL
jgi:hypothetical protein